MESNLPVTRNINIKIDSKHYIENIIHNTSSYAAPMPLHPINGIDNLLTL